MVHAWVYFPAGAVEWEGYSSCEVETEVNSFCDASGFHFASNKQKAEEFAHRNNVRVRSVKL